MKSLSSLLYWLLLIGGVIAFIMILSSVPLPNANAASPRSKFYDFNDQLIDGEVKKPTTLYTDARKRVQFDRLLRLKKSFLPKLYETVVANKDKFKNLFSVLTERFSPEKRRFVTMQQIIQDLEASDDPLDNVNTILTLLMVLVT